MFIVFGTCAQWSRLGTKYVSGAIEIAFRAMVRTRNDSFWKHTDFQKATLVNNILKIVLIDDGLFDHFAISASDVFNHIVIHSTRDKSVDNTIQKNYPVIVRSNFFLNRTLLYHGLQSCDFVLLKIIDYNIPLKPFQILKSTRYILNHSLTVVVVVLLLTTLLVKTIL